MALVTISVPSDAEPGERYGAVWAEVRSAPIDGSSVIQVNRVGLRLYLSGGPDGSPAADFTIDSLIAERSPSGEPLVLASVLNTGGRALDMSGTLELLGGPGGLSAGPFPANLGVTLALGETEPVTIALDPLLPAGPWDARITCTAGSSSTARKHGSRSPTPGHRLRSTRRQPDPHGWCPPPPSWWSCSWASPSCSPGYDNTITPRASPSARRRSSRRPLWHDL